MLLDYSSILLPLEPILEKSRRHLRIRHHSRPGTKFRQKQVNGVGISGIDYCKTNQFLGKLYSFTYYRSDSEDPIESIINTGFANALPPKTVANFS